MIVPSTKETCSREERRQHINVLRELVTHHVDTILRCCVVPTRCEIIPSNWYSLREVTKYIRNDESTVVPIRLILYPEHGDERTNILWLCLR